jgi:hypothetical protein
MAEESVVDEVPPPPSPPPPPPPPPPQGVLFYHPESDDEAGPPEDGPALSRSLAGEFMEVEPEPHLNPDEDPDAAHCCCGGHCLVGPEEEHMVARTDAAVCCGRLAGEEGCITRSLGFHQAIGTGERGTENLQESMAGRQPNEIRCAAYQALWVYLYGEDGAGCDPDEPETRVQLPLCCKLAIRRLWPEPSSLYMGHQTGDDKEVAPGMTSAMYQEEVWRQWKLFRGL